MVVCQMSFCLYSYLRQAIDNVCGSKTVIWQSHFNYIADLAIVLYNTAFNHLFLNHLKINIVSKFNYDKIVQTWCGPDSSEKR